MPDDDGGISGTRKPGPAGRIGLGNARAYDCTGHAVPSATDAGAVGIMGSSGEWNIR